MANDRLYSWDSRWKPGYIKDKRELNSKIYLAINECRISDKFIVIEETRADCKETINLLKNLDVKLLFADRAYDNNEILSYITKRNIKAVIPPKRNRLEQRGYKVFKVLKKRDSGLTVSFIAFYILS